MELQPSSPSTVIPGLVSIMMPAYNAQEYIGSAIQSVLAQTYTGWELVVVDDGSTDRTAEVVRGFDDKRIRLFSQANGGEAVARNHALLEMSGEYLAFLDSDDQFLPEGLEKSIACLADHPDWDGLYSDGVYIDPGDHDLGKLSAQRRGPFEGSLFEPLVRASDVFGPPICVVLRRQHLLEHPQTFDPRIVIGPDWDFFTRLAQTACFGYLSETTCRYRVHQTNITVLTGGQKRRDSLAICRQKAIRLPAFADCSVETRVYAFYDLLINLLAGKPREQDQATQWPEFAALPAAEQARLLRLSASRSIQSQNDDGYAKKWLARSLALNPADPKTRLVAWLYSFSPRISGIVLGAQSGLSSKKGDNSPFQIRQ